MTVAKRPIKRTGFYVAAQELHGIYRTNLLCGPFESALAALHMIRPVEAALRDDPVFGHGRCNFKMVVHNPKPGRKLPPGSLNLARLDIMEIIAASVK